MSARPWHKRYHSDALTGYRGLSLELRGAYSTILDLLYDSGEEALPASERWMAGQLDVSTRKWRAIRDDLQAAGKIEVMADGRVTNARYLRERGLIRELSEVRAEAGSAGGKARAGKVHDKLSTNSGVESGVESELSGKDKSDEPRTKPLENKEPDQASATAKPSPRTRVPESRNQTLPQLITEPDVVGANSDEKPGRDGAGKSQGLSRLDDTDLWALYQAVAQASGHNPSQPGQVDRAFGFVKLWREDGIDFEQIVLPTIRAVISETRDPTRTLGRFDARIRHEHARLAATPKNGKYVPPASPILEPAGEEPKFRPMRAALLEALGPVQFSRFVNQVRFVDLGKQQSGRVVLKIEDPRSGSLGLMDAERVPIIRSLARKFGFDDVW